jgi:hypothetical protein
MRLFYPILLITMLLSCNERKKVATSEVEPSEPKGTFYPVYQLSPTTTAFVVDFSENDKKGWVDSVFDRIVHIDSSGVCDMPDCRVYDSSGAYNLVQNDRLTAELRKRFDKEYFIYGTQGSTKASIRSVVFGLDQCRTNIVAFCLDSLSSIGHPVFCSDKKIDLQYAKDYGAVEKNIESWLSKQPADYKDSIQEKVLGNAGSYYFTYNDDFLWGKKEEDAKCKFPARSIYKISGADSVSLFWSDGLDLFGIPCD